MLILDLRIWETMIYQRKFHRRITISSLWCGHFCSIQKTETFLTDFSGAWYQIWRPSKSAAVAFFQMSSNPLAVTLLPTLNYISTRYCGILFFPNGNLFPAVACLWNGETERTKGLSKFYLHGMYSFINSSLNGPNLWHWFLAYFHAFYNGDFLRLTCPKAFHIGGSPRKTLTITYWVRFMRIRHFFVWEIWG